MVDYSISLMVLALVLSVATNCVLLYSRKSLKKEVAGATALVPALEDHIRRSQHVGVERDMEFRSKLSEKETHWEKRIAELEFELKERKSEEALRLREAELIAFKEGQQSVWKEFQVEVQPFVRVESSKLFWKKATTGYVMSLTVKGMPTIWAYDKVLDTNVEFDEKAYNTVLKGLNSTIRETAKVLEKLPVNYLPAKMLQ